MYCFQAGLWDKNEEIPDMVSEYRYPMIHWACTLGKERKKTAGPAATATDLSGLPKV